MANNLTSLHAQNRLRDAMRGDVNAFYDLGVCYSSGTAGCALDLVEAHKWFNLAAAYGLVTGQEARADISEDMTAREIAAAQRAARDWIAGTQRRAA